MLNTFNRGKLKKLAADGQLEMVKSYHFDDMQGESRTEGEKVIPVKYPRPMDWHDRLEGVLYLDDFEFSTGSGCCYKNSNGTITLIVHSNCNYTFRVKPGADTNPITPRKMHLDAPPANGIDYIDRVDRVETLLHDWHEAGRAYFEKHFANLDYDGPQYVKTAKFKEKYVYLDDGGSGAFLVDRADNRIYCIKAYGVINRRKCVGKLEEVTGAQLIRHRWW